MNMRKPSFDPGLTQQYIKPLSRVINKDGEFNVRRTGGAWNDFHPYMHLINMSWPVFLGTIILGYFLINLFFACIYYAVGVNQLDGANAPTVMGRFLNMFFFSSHTLSTVGYGNIAPRGIGANIVAAFEALTGILGLAVATGLLFGRISKPSARIGFSASMLVAPYQDGTALEFRVANRRSNALIEAQAKLLLMTVEPGNGGLKRNFSLLNLERDGVMFLLAPWTIVHPIDHDSPLWGKTAEDLTREQAEVLILIKAYDDTFAQTVQARHSYRHDEFVWGRKFAPAFSIDAEGDLVVDLNKIGDLQ
jgi:inward rectifier potassium channel